MRWLTSSSLLIYSFVLCLACGDNNSSEAPLQVGTAGSGNPTQQNNQPMPTDGSVTPALGFLLPSGALATGRDLTEAGAYAVLIATQSVGAAQIITTGTVSFEGQTPMYSPTPTDALVLVLDNLQYRYQVQSFRIDAQADSLEALFQLPHDIDFQVGLVSQVLNLSLRSQATPQSWQFYMLGTVGSEALGSLTIELQQRSASAAEIGSNSGVEYDSGSVLTGSVRSQNGRFEAAVNERTLYVAVALDRVAEERHHYVNHEFVLDGRTYGFQDVYFRSAFLDGCPNDADFWKAEGVVQENGQVVGSMTMRQVSGGFVFVLVMESEQVVLEQYAYCG